MDQESHAVLSEHSRRFEDLHFAYPVVSRRSRGLSLGLNVNPDKACNFDCIYCQVDRTTPGRDRNVDFEQMISEVDYLLGLAASGEIWQHERFRHTPPEFRRLNDIAFAGDAEPTTYPRLGDAIAEVARLREAHDLHQVKIIVLTNGTRLHETPVLEALEGLRDGPGRPYEIWVKLDAGTQEYFERVAGPGHSLDEILSRITVCARRFEITIQSLFITMDGEGPGETELEAYCGRLNQILEQGGTLRQVQVYTTARRPAERLGSQAGRLGSLVGMIEDSRLDAIREFVSSRVAVPVEVYYGRDWN